MAWLKRCRSAILIALWSLASPAPLHAAPGEGDFSADCELFTLQDANRVFGVTMSPPDVISRRNGACIFLAQPPTEGMISYSLITASRLKRVRETGALAMGTCSAVTSPERREACALYARLAKIQTVDDAYNALTAGAREDVEHLGERATFASRTGDVVLVVQSAGTVYSIDAERRDGTDRPLAVTVARTILEHASGRAMPLGAALALGEGAKGISVYLSL